MVQVLVHHQFADYNSWRSVFDAALDFRHNGASAAAVSSAKPEIPTT